MTLMMMEIHLTRAARAVGPRRAARHHRRRRRVAVAAVQVTTTRVAVHRRTRMKSHRPRRARSRRVSVCDDAIVNNMEAQRMAQQLKKKEREKNVFLCVVVNSVIVDFLVSFEEIE